MKDDAVSLEDFRVEECCREGEFYPQADPFTITDIWCVKSGKSGPTETIHFVGQSQAQCFIWLFHKAVRESKAEKIRFKSRNAQLSTIRSDIASFIDESTEAMNDLLASPKGVVPESAEKFYNSRTGKFEV